MACGASEVSGHDEAGGSGTTIEIKIKTMDSQTYTLEVDKQMPVPALKERIASVTGVVTDHQRLICRGKVLKDDQLLSAYHVEDGHTLHLVVREPAAASSESSPSDPAFDRSSNGNRGQLFQVAPGIVVETFNMPGQGDRGLSDVSRIVSAVLGSIGITNTGTGSEIRDTVADRPGEAPIPGGTADATQTSPEQSGVRSSNDRSRLHNAFGFPAAVSSGSLQAPVIPDALATLSQYLSHMRQEFLNNGRAGETNNGVVSSQDNESGPSPSAQAESAHEGLPTLASLAELVSATRQMLNQQAEECLLQLRRQLENQENITDPGDRVSAQAGAMRTGILLQNLGPYFLELGRAVTTLRFGRSPSETVVNSGPAVYISPSGPNPLMVQPLPFQPGASFGTPLTGTAQSGSALINGPGAGFVPRRIDIQIRRVGPSTHQTEPAGTRQSVGQTLSSISGNVERPVNHQPAPGTSDAPSLNNGAGVRVSPLRTMMAAVPDLNSSPSESSGGSLGFLYPLLGRFPNLASGNVSSRTENQVSSENHSSGVRTQLQSTPESVAFQQNVEDPTGNGRLPASSSGQRESATSRTIDINFLSAGGILNDQNSEGQVPPGIVQFLRGLFPGGEFHVESISSQGTATEPVPEQPRTSSTVVQEAEPRATEEGLFLSWMLQQIMPLISQDAGTDQNVVCPGEGVSTQQKDGSASSTPPEDSQDRTSRRRGDPNPGPPNSKRQKME